MRGKNPTTTHKRSKQKKKPNPKQTTTKNVDGSAKIASSHEVRADYGVVGDGTSTLTSSVSSNNRMNKDLQINF